MKWNFAYSVSFLLLWALPAQADSKSAAPLFFTAEPEDAIVSRGGTLALYCNVTTKNGEETKVTWFKEGDANYNSSRGSILILNDNADSKDRANVRRQEIDGYYYCVAQTKNLAIRSRSALVKRILTTCTAICDMFLLTWFSF